MKVRFHEERLAVILQVESADDAFQVGELYGSIPALGTDCLQHGPGTGEQISLTIPVSYLLNAVLHGRKDSRR